MPCWYVRANGNSGKVGLMITGLVTILLTLCIVALLTFIGLMRCVWSYLDRQEKQKRLNNQYFYYNNANTFTANDAVEYMRKFN